jgi:hypothetical protein
MVCYVAWGGIGKGMFSFVRPIQIPETMAENKILTVYI